MSRRLFRTIILLFALLDYAPLHRSQALPEKSSGMTVVEARIALRKSLLAMLRGGLIASCSEKNLQWVIAPVQDLVISSDEVRFINRGTWYYEGGEPLERAQVFRFDRNHNVSVRECRKKGRFGIIWAGTEKLTWVDNGFQSWATISDAQLFADALSVLIFEYPGGDLAKEAAEFERFKAIAKLWRELTVKPELSEETHREKVLAEDAIREKDLEAAILHYQAGLKFTPLWPQGHFNVALLHGEFGDHFDAVRHMRRYLELAPDAADAQAARDKSIVWEYKAQQRKRGAPVAAPKP